ncbi:MAG: rhomboid family intramembrane serine protease [Desulfobacterales bacterium]|nr:rhomboid family intramembrane serine protease [Desulfobacterales bacterium]
MKKNYKTLALFVGVIWVIHLINSFTGHALSSFGLAPRSVTGLPGIALCPFLHRDLFHLLLNTAPLIILGGLVMLRGIRKFTETTVLIVIIGGFLVWIFGRPGIHIGASGLIYGYFGYLVAAGWYERNAVSIIIALVVIFFYGGMLWGLLPLQASVSWEGHLAGLFAGVLAGGMLKKHMARSA